MGTRFINTSESRATAGYQQMIIDSQSDDIILYAGRFGHSGEFPQCIARRLWP
jgi:NAD(P)H-dependent flavin oxidoreductase YrpB (nitropropane dioxygenase family)